MTSKVQIAGIASATNVTRCFTTEFGFFYVEPLLEDLGHIDLCAIYWLIVDRES